MNGVCAVMWYKKNTLNRIPARNCCSQIPVHGHGHVVGGAGDAGVGRLPGRAAGASADWSTENTPNFELVNNINLVFVGNIGISV